MEKNIQNRRKKRRIMLLLIALLFTLVLFTSSTYAWFTANQTVKVSTLTVNVAAQNGIQISTDGTNWKSIIQTTDITGASSTYADAVNQLPATMEPVSTIGKIDEDGMMEMFYGTVGSDSLGRYILTASKSTEQNGTTGKFIAFDLFFKVDSDTSILLDTNSGVRTTDTTDKGIKNASRIAFVVLGNTSAGSSISTIQGLNAGESANKYIWEPNYDVHTAAAVTHAFDTYGVEDLEEEDAARLTYQGVKAEITGSNVLVRQSSPTAYSTAYGDYFDTVNIAYATKAGFSEQVQLFPLTAGVTKVRIYMWIEGQDVDCENNASGGTITYDLQISTPTQTTP